MRFSRSRIQEIIKEEVEKTEEDIILRDPMQIDENLNEEETELQKATNKMRTARREWKKAIITAMEYEKIKQEYEDIRKKLNQQPSLPAPKIEPEFKLQSDQEKIPEYQLEIVGKLRDLASNKPAVIDLLSMLDTKQQQDFINYAIEEIDTVPDEQKERAINNISIQTLYDYLDKASKSEPVSAALVLTAPIVKPAPEQEEPQDVEQKQLPITIETAGEFVSSEKNEEKFKILASQDVSGKDKVEVLLPMVLDFKQQRPELDDVSNKQIAQLLMRSVEFVARKSFDEAYLPLEDAFEEYEDVFGTTPYLGEQARVLFKLKAALDNFVNNEKLKQAGYDIDIDRTRPQDIVQEQEEIEVPKEKRQMIFSLHKEIIKGVKDLVQTIKMITKDNIATIQGRNIRKSAKLQARELIQTLLNASSMLSNITDEEKEMIKFAENVINEQKEVPLEDLRKAHRQVLSNMTKVDKIARSEGEAKINIKYIDDPINDTMNQIKMMLPYFPSTERPFGKAASIKEIKRQVNGIARDITDVISELKRFVVQTKTRSKNIDRLNNLIISAVSLLREYFNIDIEDSKFRALLPPPMSPNQASYNQGAQEKNQALNNISDKIATAVKNSLGLKESLSMMLDKEGISDKKLFIKKLSKILTPEELELLKKNMGNKFFINLTRKKIKEKKKQKLKFKENITPAKIQETIKHYINQRK